MVNFEGILGPRYLKAHIPQDVVCMYVCIWTYFNINCLINFTLCFATVSSKDLSECRIALNFLK